MAAAAAIIGIVGGVVSGIGAMQQGQAQADAARYQAQVARNNEIIAEEQANATRQEGAIKAQMEDQKSAQLIGKQDAILGASGVDMESGSALAVRQSQAGLARLDALTVRSNAEKKAWGFDVEASNQRAQQQLDYMKASAAEDAGQLGMFSSILGGASSAAKSWSAGGIT